MVNIIPKSTKPRPVGVDAVKDANSLAVGRYGTREMCDILGAERTMDDSLFVQGESARTIHQEYPEIVSESVANDIVSKSSLEHVSPDRIRELETEHRHDIIGITKAIFINVFSDLRIVVSIFSGHCSKFLGSVATFHPMKRRSAVSGQRFPLKNPKRAIYTEKLFSL